MLVEPPGPVLPPRAGLTISADRLRTAAAAAALVLAVTSRGDALGLAVLLAVVAWRPVAAAAVGVAFVATSWRWGSTSLEAIAGAQAVLGPAGVVEPNAAAAASWLAAGAIVLASPGDRGEVRGMRARSARGGAPNLAGRVAAALPALASGTAAAVVVAGPAPGGDVWIRVVAALLATALAAVAGWGRSHRGRFAVAFDAGALVAGLGALVLVSSDAPAWSGTIDTSAAGYGALTAMAVGTLIITGGTAVAMGRRHP